MGKLRISFLNCSLVWSSSCINLAVGTSDRSRLRSVGLSWDKLPAQNASLDDLDSDLVNQYVQQASEVRGKKVGHGESPKQVLEKMELVKEGKPTWAALLLFQRRPQRYLSQAAVHCGRFKDATAVIDDSVIEGTIIEQITATMGSLFASSG